MMNTIWGYAVVLVALTCAFGSGASQSYKWFRPRGYDSLQHLPFGRGPDPFDGALHLTQVQAESDLCEGLNDVLTVTLTAPIVGDISPEQFSALYCYIVGQDPYRWPPRHCETIVPKCAHLQLQDSPNERRTLLLFGQFVKFEGHLATHALVQTDMKHVTFLIDGRQQDVYGEYAAGEGFIRSVLCV